MALGLQRNEDDGRIEPGPDEVAIRLPPDETGEGISPLEYTAPPDVGAVRHKGAGSSDLHDQKFVAPE